MQDSNEFTFSIEGKDYTISEKKSTQEKSIKQTLHAPSLGIGAIIAGICIVGVFFGLSDFSESSEPLIEKQLIQEPQIPQQDSIDTFIQNGSPILGNPNAPITLIEFGDYQCHFCNVYYHNTEHKIFENFVMTGKVNVIYKDYTIIGPDSVKAALGAHCASDQNRFWEFHNILFENWDGENKGWAGEENIVKFANELDLDMNEFTECFSKMKYEGKIAASNANANALEITGTPAFYVISMENQRVQAISGAQPYEVFEKIFNSMLET